MSVPTLNRQMAAATWLLHKTLKKKAVSLQNRWRSDIKCTTKDVEATIFYHVCVYVCIKAAMRELDYSLCLNRAVMSLEFIQSSACFAGNGISSLSQSR